MRKDYDFSQGRRGPVIASPGKTRITIMLDDDILEHFRSSARAQGIGYQTLINTALREALRSAKPKNAEDELLTVAILRKVLREELQIE